MALQGDLPGVPVAGAMVACRHHRRRRRHRPARDRDRVHGAPGARHRGAVELPADQPGGARTHDQDRRRQSPRRLGQSGRGLAARGERRPAGRRRALRRRQGRRRHPRQGRLPQPADRADPVRAGHRQGAPRADPDRAGLDHEVLHPRSVAGEFASSAISSTPASPSSSSRGRIPIAATATSASTTIAPSASRRRSTPSPPSSPTARSMRSATASAARSLPSPPPPWPATATTASPR